MGDTTMSEHQFIVRNKKMVKIGHSYGFSIPRHWIKDGGMDVSAQYDVIVQRSIVQLSEPSKEKKVEDQRSTVADCI